MDACDSVMDKINRPLGLIRIDSDNNIRNKKGFRFSPRVIAYSVVMLLLIGLSTVLVLTRKNIDADVFRIPGLTYTETDDGLIQNIYNLSLVNKTFQAQDLRLELENRDAELILVRGQLDIMADTERKDVFMIQMQKQRVKRNVTPVHLKLYQDDKLIRTFETKFLAPLE
jgi:polyferredoxin